MLVAQFHGARDVRIQEVPEPERELAATEVLVSPRWCGICGTDLHEYAEGPIFISRDPHPLTGVSLPQILGHEFAGDVEAVGREVKAVRPGDRVSIMPMAFCGECYYCRRGLNHLCPSLACVGLSTRWGGFAAKAVLQEYQVSRLPGGVSYEQGALIEPAAVALNAVHRAGVQAGDTVLVAGAGPIGGLCVLAARAAGAAQVLVSEPNPKRSSRAEALGADLVIDPAEAEIGALVRERTEGRGVDIAIECAGNAAALRACLEVTRPRGVVALVALHGKEAPIDALDLAARELSLIGVYAYSVHDWPRVSALIESGSFPVERVVTSTIPLAEIVGNGFEELLDPRSDQTKVLVDPAST